MNETLPPWLGALLGDGPPRAVPAIASVPEEVVGAGGLVLTSAAFANGEALDESFTAHEEDAVAPPLDWSAPPSGTAELLLLVEDVDAPGAPCHWLVWGLPAQRAKLLEGETPPRAGKNAAGNSEWLPPPLAAEDGTHRYLFQLFASDVAVDLPPGATREQVLARIAGRVTGAAALLARFAAPDEDWDEAEDDGPG
ncbi:YbhB/YbcL family Raf kinase inhibitor-like protein [Erythrobacteraceae bacterium CFH 75059]|uniref:YbhB/YbcL family Raf kinase inhibitor-like protein n=1 Tax=Qipengyuania thermophila TaxID=2509361 RepID=UPI001020A864|nr:YbhB/YbcL family Raf kinase inhibitor-like protein [Qipengyuania thermophila]TCD02052.1 YbhB/YbcL family Raf kinase inhibitor-like protein [Erythrobacteraceae bacterium CFH 75059]